MLNNILGYVFSFLIIISGAMTLPTVVDWIQATNQEIGTSQDLEKTTDLDVYANGYTITYNLDGGTVFYGNPTNYNLFTETFTLNNPTKQGYDFLGWTSDTLTEPTLTVTICKGSSGNVEFTANYKKIVVPTNLVRCDSDDTGLYVTCDEMEGATSCWFYINGNLYNDTAVNSGLTKLVGDNLWKISELDLTEETNIFKVVYHRPVADGSDVGTSMLSYELEYTCTDKLDTPVLTVENNSLVFNAIDNANMYYLRLGTLMFELVQNVDYTITNGVVTVPITGTNNFNTYLQRLADLGVDYVNDDRVGATARIYAVNSISGTVGCGFADTSYHFDVA